MQKKDYKSGTVQRLFAFALACGYLFAYLGTFMHMLEENHVVCEEHGHLMHADEHHEVASLEISEDLSKFTSKDSHDDHHHCAEAFVFQKSRILSEPPNLPPIKYELVAGPREYERMPVTIRGPNSDVLAYAPKTSPPFS